MSTGTLYGISLGPGDPGLITRAAWDQLQRRDAVWVYPARSGKTPSYALDIVVRAG
jgi:precorrin-2/cobalt-factor-2 C20-methyltransferase